jgi:DNA anti-recombination protein RmuC
MPEDPVVSLREYLQAKLQALIDRVDQISESSNRALDKAQAATEKRFESVNEFRAALNDQTRNLLPRQEYDVRHQALLERTETNAARLTKLEASLLGKSQGVGSVGTVVLGSFVALNSVCALAAILITLLHK